MSGLFSAAPGSPVTRRPDDEEELSRLRMDLFPEVSPSGLEDGGGNLDAEPETVPLRRLPDLSQGIPTRMRPFDVAGSHLVAQAGTVSTDAGNDPYMEGAKDDPENGWTTAPRGYGPPYNPTMRMKPGEVVDAAIATVKAEGEVPDPLFVGFMRRLLEREGGYKPETVLANNRRDPETNRGVTETTRKARLNRAETPNLPASVIELTPRNYYDVYRQYLKESKAELLQQFPDLQKQAPRLAEFIFDSSVQHGPKDAAEWLQQALNRLVLQSGVLGGDGDDIVRRVKAAMRTVQDKGGIPSDKKIDESVEKYLILGSDGMPQLKVDGGIGPLTLAIVKLASDEGLMKSVSDQMVRSRDAYLRIVNAGQEKGNRDRLQYFLGGSP